MTTRTMFLLDGTNIISGTYAFSFMGYLTQNSCDTVILDWEAETTNPNSLKLVDLEAVGSTVITWNVADGFTEGAQPTMNDPVVVESTWHSNVPLLQN